MEASNQTDCNDVHKLLILDYFHTMYSCLILENIFTYIFQGGYRERHAFDGLAMEYGYQDAKIIKSRDI